MSRRLWARQEKYETHFTIGEVLNFFDQSVLDYSLRVKNVRITLRASELTAGGTVLLWYQVIRNQMRASAIRIELLMRVVEEACKRRVTVCL